ncbi:MAG: 8-amino-7-oxononanoate synthase, partial [Bacteroidetes bacterium HGW-Bacteroidetes-22]
LKEAGFNIGNTESPVTPVFLNGGISEATAITHDMRERFNIFCSIVTYPVIPKGYILLRLIPTAIHTLEDVKYTIESFRQLKSKLDSGEYADGGFVEPEKL